MYRLIPLFTILLLVSPAAVADEAETPDLAAAAKAAGTVNGLCPVMKRPVTPDGGFATYRGERIGFCCPPCKAKFEADPVRYMDRMRVNPSKYAYTSKSPSAADVAAAAKAAGSANGICPVMERLVSPKGDSSIYKGQTIAFCCPPCKTKFEADPEAFMRKLRADPRAYGYARPGPTHTQLRVARETAGAANGLCPVMGNLVTSGGGFASYQGLRIGFCCPPCRDKFLADPESFLSKMRLEPAVYGFLPPK